VTDQKYLGSDEGKLYIVTKHDVIHPLSIIDPLQQFLGGGAAISCQGQTSDLRTNTALML